MTKSAREQIGDLRDEYIADREHVIERLKRLEGCSGSLTSNGIDILQGCIAGDRRLIDVLAEDIAWLEREMEKL